MNYFVLLAAGLSDFGIFCLPYDATYHLSLVTLGTCTCGIPCLLP